MGLIFSAMDKPLNNDIMVLKREEELISPNPSLEKRGKI